jgi:hypothetical protein
MIYWFFAYTAHSQIQEFTLVNNRVLQYEKAEWNIRLTAEWLNPYLQEEISLDMLLTSSSGKKMILPCYYESGESGKESLWKARFTPQDKGNYTFQFQLSKLGKVVSVSKSASFVSIISKKNGFLHVKNNWVLQFDNGKLFRGIGEDICWESRANDDSKFFKELHQNPKYNYDYMLPSLAKHGGNFYRTWICPWNLPIDWKSGFNSNRYSNSDNYYNPSAVEKLDSLVTLSDSLGLYMMLTLGQGAYEVSNGGFATSAADFFVNPQSKIKYKNRLRYIIARWGYSTSIGAWEFFNEVDNIQFSNRNAPISEVSIVQWHDEMSTYLKSIDIYGHIVTTSISHRDLKGLNSLANIDINQKHIYKNNVIIPATIVKYEEDYKKPYVIGEYGYEYDWQKNFNLFAKEMDGDFKRGLWYGLFSSTPILPMSWWWEFFDDRGTDAYLSKVKKISNEMLETGKGSFEKVAINVSDSLIQILGVRCGNKTFVYVYNTTGEVKQLAVTIALKTDRGCFYKLYDCESDTYSIDKKIKSVSDQLSINNIRLADKSDVILVINNIN